MSQPTIIHPLALDDTPDEPLPRRVTVYRDGTRYRELVDPETGSFAGTKTVLERLADEYDVAPERLTDDGRLLE